MESALVIDLQLDFSPIVEPFAEGRAFFFCPLEEHVNRIVAKNFVTVQGEKVVLNKWDRNIDTCNTEEMSSKGWIYIKGLLFIVGKKPPSIIMVINVEAFWRTAIALRTSLIY